MLSKDNKTKNKTLLIFFNGWSMDERVISHLSTDGYDLICISDYTIERDYQQLVSAKYQHRILIAWSFGVYLAAHLLKNITFDLAIAVNGTLQPIDGEQGIAPEIFQQTVDGLSEINLLNFYKRCGVKKNISDFLTANISRRSIESLKSELELILSLYTNNQELANIFNHTVIGLQDRIFLPENQKTFWQNKCTISEIPVPHYPFYGFSSWKEFIDAATG